MKIWMPFLACVMLSISCWAGQTVDINSATAEQIAEALDGVGDSKAQLIVEYRETHGNFRHADELVNVKGIGLATLNKNRDYILINENPELATSGE